MKDLHLAQQEVGHQGEPQDGPSYSGEGEVMAAKGLALTGPVKIMQEFEDRWQRTGDELTQRLCDVECRAQEADVTLQRLTAQMGLILKEGEKIKEIESSRAATPRRELKIHISDVSTCAQSCTPENEGKEEEEDMEDASSLAGTEAHPERGRHRCG